MQVQTARAGLSHATTPVACRHRAGRSFAAMMTGSNAEATHNLIRPSSGGVCNVWTLHRAFRN